MSDAKKVSGLISKSLRHELGKDEADQLVDHLNENSESRKYSELSRAIQTSVVHGADSVLDDVSVCSEFKQRLKDSVAAVANEKTSLSKSGLLRNERTLSDSEGGSVAPGSEHRQISSHFRLLRKIGAGGLGNVWLARDERLNRNVAVKELNAEALESPKAWQRFHREAEITGQLEHPNIVPIYQFGDDRRSSEPFYTMRFVGKRTLADAIIEHHDRVEAGEDGPLGLHRLLAVFLDVCQAIAYAHSRGVVHRDLKPENVALDNFGQVIVLDWGLAKLTDDGDLSHKLTSEATLSDSAMSNTMQGDVIGTPLYMAPEQASGELDKVDEKTDVYGLGAILFAILTGSAPHERSSAEKTLKDVLVNIAKGETPKARELRTSVSSDLEAICAKAMARKRHLRFESVPDFAEAIERWMAGQSEKHARYDSLRMEGRELRANLQSAVSDLERNARFMSRLPPIQKLITAETDQDISDWRERLATIFQGLLEASPDYRSVVYNRVEGDRFTELVRVERHSRDSSRVRVVPRSRLRDAESSKFINSVVVQKPEEVITSLVCDPLCDSNDCTVESLGLVAGVPVYDDRTEDSFGIVMIDCDINQVLRRQMTGRLTSSEIVVACDIMHIMMRYKDGRIVDDSIGKPVDEKAPHFSEAMKELQSELEYIDEATANVYGARLWFVPNQHGLMYLLR